MDFFKGCEKVKPSRGYLNQMNPIKRWKDVKDFKCIPQYLAHELTFHQPQMIIGENDCSINGEVQSCKLRAGTKYELMIRLCTSKTYADSKLFPFETDSGYLLMIVIVISIILVVSLAGFISLHKDKFFQL